jgi:hypothetical protein
MDEDLPRIVHAPQVQPRAKLPEAVEDASEDTEAVVAESPPSTKQVFVAYSYKAYPKADYRKVFTELEKTYDVKFVFADEKITNMHIMAKIISYIRSSDFSLFDITGWNPNVTLELGWAMASGDGWYICFDPSKTDVKEVPSDLRGIDRMEYDSYTALQAQLSVLLAQRYPKRTTAGIGSFLDEKRQQAIESLGKQPGLTMKSLAQLLGVETQVAQFLMQPLVGKTVETTGKTRGMKYYLKGQVPKRGST